MSDSEFAVRAELTPEQAEEMLERYRTKYPQAVKFWEQMEKDLKMNSDKLYTMTEAILDETLKLREQSAFNHASDAARREMIREVLHIWEERKIRNRFYEIVTDEELGDFFDELQDCDLSLQEVLEELNRKFEIRRDA